MKNTSEPQKQTKAAQSKKGGAKKTARKKQSTALTVWQTEYARLRANGMTQKEAYRGAYPKSSIWKDKTVESKASRLEKEVKVYAAIAEYQRERRERAIELGAIDDAMVLQELAKIAFADIGDFVNVDKSGHVWVKSFDSMPENKRGALAGARNGAYGAEIALHDKTKALKMLGDALGLFDVIKGDKNADVEDITLAIEEAWGGRK